MQGGRLMGSTKTAQNQVIAPGMAEFPQQHRTELRHDQRHSDIPSVSRKDVRDHHVDLAGPHSTYQ